MAKFTKNIKKGPVPHKVLSDRGVLLEQASQRRHCSSIGFGQTAFVWTNPSGKEVPVKIGQECPKCKKRVRGFNHTEGAHHNGTASR